MKTSKDILIDELWKREQNHVLYNYTYYCIFEQKYEWEQEWHKIFVSCELMGRRGGVGMELYDFVFDYDFCEGETCVRNLHIFNDDEVHDILLKEVENNENDD